MKKYLRLDQYNTICGYVRTNDMSFQLNGAFHYIDISHIPEAEAIYRNTRDYKATKNQDGTYTISKKP